MIFMNTPRTMISKKQNITKPCACFVAWWRHQMETFSALLAICAENSPVPGEFPAQRPVTRSFDVFFDLRLNKRLSKQLWGWWFETLSHPLWRHRNGTICVNVGVSCCYHSQQCPGNNYLYLWPPFWWRTRWMIIIISSRPDDTYMRQVMNLSLTPIIFVYLAGSYFLNQSWLNVYKTFKDKFQ